MMKSSKNWRKTAIFNDRWRHGFRYGGLVAALAKWPPNRAVSRVSESWQSHGGQLRQSASAVGFGGRLSGRSVRQPS